MLPRKRAQNSAGVCFIPFNGGSYFRLKLFSSLRLPQVFRHLRRSQRRPSTLHTRASAFPVIISLPDHAALPSHAHSSHYSITFLIIFSTRNYFLVLVISAPDDHMWSTPRRVSIRARREQRAPLCNTLTPEPSPPPSSSLVCVAAPPCLRRSPFTAPLDAPRDPL